MNSKSESILLEESERIKVSSFRIKVMEKNSGNQGEQKEGRKPELPNHNDQIPEKKI